MPSSLPRSLRHLLRSTKNPHKLIDAYETFPPLSLAPPVHSSSCHANRNPSKRLLFVSVSGPEMESSEPSEPEQVSLYTVPGGQAAGELESTNVPLIRGDSSGGGYSISAAILPITLYYCSDEPAALLLRLFAFFVYPKLAIQPADACYRSYSDSDVERGTGCHTCSQALGGLLFGYDIGATGGAQFSIESPTLSGTTWYKLSSLAIGLVVSGSMYGALIGSILAFTVADFLGRRRELIFASLLYLVGALLTSLAPNFSLMVVGRLVYGAGIGLVMHAAPIYIAETCPREIRGILVSLKEFFLILGLLVGYTISSICVDLFAGWRYMYASSIPISLIMGIGMWWLPPSPRWLLLCALQGKGSMATIKQVAVACFCRLRGQANQSLALAEVDSILDELSSDHEKQATISEIFQGKCLKALVIGAGLVFLQQMTGQPSVLYYAATILQSAGFSAASDATRVSILIGVLKLVITGFAVLVVDRVGRRPLLLLGVSGMAISLFLLSAYYTFLKDLPIVAVSALLLYVGCYQMSFGPVGWLMISEVFPLKLRGRGLSVAVLVNFTSNALVTFAFSPMQDLVGNGIIFAGFGVVAIASLVFIFFIVPETKGLTLEEIEAKILVV
ncbi:D-xylose-proton symporter-like 2 isoform X2 [Canna indica]|uniref:D-xylose-proton symporter-like 2 isoform X2 n=1 Tax=Canna indica TaxID=4628 RepID=A0AAQ3QC92_9LILI|nr:D-xylose-proton symporter-like 2 isoform X2 [Canna indica]